MYLTAQRVRTRTGEEGVNTFLFLHRGEVIPGMSWTAPDVKLIADQHPGRVVVQRREQDSVGNDVLSYLDVVAEDSHGIPLLKAALSATSFEPARGAVWSVGPVSFRFFRANANSRDDATEFQVLRDHALFLLLTPGAVARSAPEPGPLQIIAADQEGLGVIYHLEQEAQRRLRQLRPEYIPASLRVAYEDRDSIVSLWGEEEFHRQIALALTGLSERDLAKFGGVTVTDLYHQLSPQILARSEALGGQETGDWFGPEDWDVRTADEPIPTGWPTGALLRAGDLALDLVYIERAWYPLSEAAVPAYLHSAGLKRGETWRFVTRSQPRAVYRVSLGPSIARRQVAAVYGDDAAARAHPDHPTLQLRVVRE